MNKRLSLLLCVLLLLPVLLVGCTPYKELKDLAIIVGAGIDLNPDGSYLLTYQILDASGGGGGGDKACSGTKTTVLQTSGKSLFDASRNATKQIGKKLYYSNNRMLVLGKGICADGISDIIDFLERNHEISPTERVFMAENMAQDILLAKNDKGYISGDDIAKMAENNYSTSMILDQTVNDFEADESSRTTDVSLPVLSVKKVNGASSGTSGGSADSSNNTTITNSGAKGKNTASSTSGSKSGSSQPASSSTGKTSSSGSSSSSTSSASGGSSGSSSSGSSSGGGGSDIQSVQINSTAVFSSNKLSGILDSATTRGILWIREKANIKSGAIVVRPAEGGIASMEILSNKTKMTVNEQGEKPSITVDIGFTSRLFETEIQKYTMDQKFIKQLEALQNQVVKLEAESAVNQALKKSGSDVFGFGQKIYQTKPELWRNIQKNWKQDSKNLSVQFNVHSAIENNGH